MCIQPASETNRHRDRQRDRLLALQIKGKGTHTDRQTDRHRNRLADRLLAGKTDRQTDRERNRQMGYMWPPRHGDR